MRRTPEHEILADRVRHCVPSSHPAFGMLLQLLAIEASTTVPTAAVTTGSRSRLLLNPDFVARRCRTDAHLAMLVMHELHHVLLGHTRLRPRLTLADNWAFDCVINALLCRQYPGSEHRSFFTAEAATAGPWSLLAPPPGWPKTPRYAPGRLGELHRRLYDDAGVTTAELFASLDAAADALGADGATALLGSHEAEDARQDPLRADPELLAEVARVVARWPMVERLDGTDDGGMTSAQQIAHRRHRAARHAITALLAAAARGDEGGRQRHVTREMPARVPLPQPRDRRGQLQRLLGADPLLWQGSVTRPTREPGGRVTVYLDVSGSMNPWLPVLLEALSAAAAIVRWPLQGFSTEVHPVSREDLAQGRFSSTGGTHIGCVVRHLLDTRVRRAVVITDGAVQSIPTALRERLARAAPQVRVGLLDGGSAGFCAGLGWPVSRIPDLGRWSAKEGRHSVPPPFELRLDPSRRR
jgi:hypothetical protein